MRCGSAGRHSLRQRRHLRPEAFRCDMAPLFGRAFAASVVDGQRDAAPLDVISISADMSPHRAHLRDDRWSAAASHREREPLAPWHDGGSGRDPIPFICRYGRRSRGCHDRQSARCRPGGSSRSRRSFACRFRSAPDAPRSAVGAVALYDDVDRKDGVRGRHGFLRAPSETSSPRMTVVPGPSPQRSHHS